MREFEHQSFMKANSLSKSAFSIPLQEKLGIFEKLHAKLNDTIDEDREELTDELEELDQEIYENMLEEYEEVLINNELDEEIPEELLVQKGTTKEPKLKEQPSDEAVLDGLYKMKRTENLGRSLLKDLGVKTDLSAWNISLGKYELQRTAVFRFIYRLKKIQ